MTKRASKRQDAAQTKAIATRRPWYERDAVVLLLLAVVTLIVFSPAFTAEFVSWDDNLNVSKNPWLNPPSFERIGHFWKGPFLDLYVPVTYSAWGALAAVAWMPTPDANGIQLNPWVFHAANVIVHLAAVWFAYALLRRLVSKPWPAAAGALLFAVHPLQVEPVAWVTGLKDVLCGALSLAALWQYACFSQSVRRLEITAGPADKKSDPIAPAAGHSSMTQTVPISHFRWLHYAAAFVLFALAILSKPLAVVIPAAALVLDLWVIRRRWFKALAAISPMLLLSIGWMVLSVKFQTVVAPADGRHILLRPLIATDALAFYIYKFVFPLWLGFHYDRAPLTVIHAGWLYYTWLIPAGIFAAVVFFRKKSPWLWPAFALFLIGVGPVLGLVPFSFQRYATVADRYVYLAMLGPAFALAAFLASYRAKVAHAGKVSGRISMDAVVAVGIVLLLFAIRSFMQTYTWHDNAALFTNALSVNPKSAAACDGLAGELASQKPKDESAEAFTERMKSAKKLAERATELAPESPDGYITLGSIDNMMHDLPAATSAFRKAVEVAPDKAEALNSLGGALAEQKQPDEAEPLLLRAIKINPTLADAHLNLALLRAQQGHLDEALDEMRVAVGLDANNAQSHLKYGLLLLQHHDLDGALAQTRIGVELDPDNAQAHVNYAMFLHFHGETQAAMEQLKFAQKINPTLPAIRAAYEKITGTQGQR